MIQEIQNYKLKDFLRKSEQEIKTYLIFLDNLKPLNYIKHKGNKIVSKGIEHLEWIKVKEIQELFYKDKNGQNLIEVFRIVFPLSVSETLSLRIIDFYCAFNYIHNDILQITKAENYNLSIEPDEKLKKAGIKRLDKHGNNNTVNALAGGDVLKWKQIEKTPYITIYKKLYLDNDLSKINKILEK